MEVKTLAVLIAMVLAGFHGWVISELYQLQHQVMQMRIEIQAARQ